MGISTALICALVMMIMLFAIAAIIEANSDYFRRRPRWRQGAYTLALGVYCSSWTFYGAVGSAARDGWSYLPIYLAPMLFLLLAPGFIQRLSQAVADERATTISDFIAARFGHDIVVARLITIIALLGTIPYVALQFRSIGSAISFVSGRDLTVPAMIGAAMIFALFAILFGARRFELAGRSEGLLYAIGVESIIKIGTLAAIGLVALLLLTDAPPVLTQIGIAKLQTLFSPAHLSFDIVIIALISAMAIIVLPRQFYMGLVEAQGTDNLVRARKSLSAYLGIMALVVIPIALAGLSLLPAGAAADLFVLELPTFGGQQWFAVVAMIGGFSAAGSMVIVDAIALAAMVSNDLIFPSILRRDASRVLRNGGGSERDGGASISPLGRQMLLIRRASIVGIMALALIWAVLMSPRESLASIGLVAFAAMAQFTPHLILATAARGRDPLAARLSLLVGLILWSYTLALPQIMPEMWLDGLSGGPFDPLRLFGIGNASPLVHGVMWSLGANIFVLALLMARAAPSNPMPRLFRFQRQITDISDLEQLTARFVGADRAAMEFPPSERRLPVNRKAAERAQRLIASVVGISSARALVTSALADGQMTIADVAKLLDQGGQSLRFSRHLLAATFENIDAGISVVDREMNLIAWNSRYVELFGYPLAMVHVGAPIANLIRHNAQHGDFGPGDIDHHVEKRLGHLRRGMDHSFERHRKDGRVIKTVGGPMPGGGYVMSFTDTTEEARVREELRATLEQLEQRVTERTNALSDANRRLASATREKTRFLAAASHDLLQPLHAARLFTAALQRDVTGGAQELVGRLDSAIVAAEDLLRALLDISLIDAGGVHPRPERLDLGLFLTDLAEGVRPIAQDRGLELRLGTLRGQVESDPGLLRSIVQNFMVNAVRYTEQGGVMIGVRRRGPDWRIDVIDTGVGIDADKVESIFGEFTRLGDVEVEGLGLGLALAERIAKLLGGRIEVQSSPRRGSRFSLFLPAATVEKVERDEPPPIVQAPVPTGQKLTVLVIDNDQRIVEASIALLTRIGHSAIGAVDMAGALAQIDSVDAVLADYHLDNGENGLDLIAAIHARRPDLPAALITAETGEALHMAAREADVRVFTKPVPPAMLEAYLDGLTISA